MEGNYKDKVKKRDFSVSFGSFISFVKMFKALLPQRQCHYGEDKK